MENSNTKKGEFKMDMNKIRQEAELEIAEENSKVAKGKIKTQLSRIKAAKLIVSNLERELEDIYAEITNNS